MSVRLLHGDCVELMRGMPECSVDAIVTDPPYELGFMGKQWDGAGIAYSVEMWGEALRVLKPGGHLLAFGGTRTYHRMACAIEDAEFEIRDSIHWVYGSGFPKSLNIGKAIDKVNGEGGRALKFTGWMRTTGLTARRLDELTGTNMGGHYVTAKSQPAIPTAGLWAVIRPHCGEVPAWVDELVTRVEAEREVVGTDTKARSTSGASALPTVGGETVYQSWDVTVASTDEAKRWEGWGTALKPAHEPIVVARKPLAGTVAGNVLVWGTGGLNIDGCRIPALDAKEGRVRHGGGVPGNGSSYELPDGGSPMPSGRWPANVVFDRTAGEALDQQSGTGQSPAPYVRNVDGGGGNQFPNTPAGKIDPNYGDRGGASRFFTQADFGPDDWPFVYQAKPSRKERNAGLDGLPEQRRSTDYGAMRKRACRVCGSRSNRNGRWPDCEHDDWEWVEQKADGHKGGNATNTHPTVKPVALMRHLVRLVTPPGGTVLDPFAGSGTTLVAAVLEGFDAVGCEMTDEYLPIIQGRVAWAEEQAAARGAEQTTLL